VETHLLFCRIDTTNFISAYGHYVRGICEIPSTCFCISVYIEGVGATHTHKSVNLSRHTGEKWINAANYRQSEVVTLKWT